MREVHGGDVVNKNLRSECRLGLVDGPYKLTGSLGEAECSFDAQKKAHWIFPVG